MDETVEAIGAGDGTVSATSGGASRVIQASTEALDWQAADEFKAKLEAQDGSAGAPNLTLPNGPAYQQPETVSPAAAKTDSATLTPLSTVQATDLSSFSQDPARQPKPGLGGTLWSHMRENFQTAFATPLGPSNEFMKPVDNLPAYAWPLQAADNLFYRGGGTALDAAARTIGATYNSAVDAAADVGESTGLLQAAQKSGLFGSPDQFRRDFKAMPEAFAGMANIAGMARTATSTVTAAEIQDQKLGQALKQAGEYEFRFNPDTLGVSGGNINIGKKADAAQSTEALNKAASVAAKDVEASQPYALLLGQKVTPEKINENLYYGTETGTTWENIVEQGGLPKRGSNLDLEDHVKQKGDSAFRGTTVMPVTQDGQGAAAWAGEGGLVLEIDGYKIPGYDVNKIMEGRVAKPDGGFGGNPLHGEQEIAIHADVPLNAIKRYGIVEELDSGRLRVRWQLNQHYGK